MSDVFPTSVPQEMLPYVNRLRSFLSDYSETNKLEEIRENTDLELYFALLDSVSEINSIGVITNYKIQEIPWTLVQMGAFLNVLTSKGILSARNSLTYSDAGGVTVQDYDKYGKYMNLFNIFINRYLSGVNSWKLNSNVENCYGGVPSEFYAGYEYD